MRKNRPGKSAQAQERSDDAVTRRGVLGLLGGAAAAAVLQTKLAGRASAEHEDSREQEEALWRRRKREIETAFEEALQTPRYR